MIAPERNPPWKKMKRDEHTGWVELRLKRWREKFPLQSNGEKSKCKKNERKPFEQLVHQTNGLVHMKG